MKLLIVVTHLLGTGHLSRALTLARAFGEAGHDVQLASGGMPAPQLNTDGVDIIQLPPLRSDGVNFARLLDDRSNDASLEYHSDRQTKLSAALHNIQPDVLITELFPFGRRSLRFEFDHLLRAAQALAKPPLILSSIRDILAPPSKPAKAQFADDVIAQFYDGVLVHSDAEITPLELSWPVPKTMVPKLHYTGFVAPPAPRVHPKASGENEILISAGGGDVGTHLFDTAKEAARLDSDHTWRILVGGQNAGDRMRHLQSNAPDNLVVEAARPDFRAMLHHAAASVSMCGYNTALDVLQTGVPAVFIPFDEGGEVEQSLRAKSLANHNQIQLVKNGDLTPATLQGAVKAAISGPKRASTGSYDGANETVRIVESMLLKRPAT